MLRRKSYRPAYGEPWGIQEPSAGRPWYTLCDRAGCERLRTPGGGEADGRFARRVLNAVNGTVNFDDVQLERLAASWNENARRAAIEP